ncbi:glycoside hydrolase family 16 protein [Viridothelium virens]|uniref:Glycoside hydrolase family 16 protein n=1 Tax=Viridothelium virens TaxID=1048519 RepID=A0A6A6H0R6_VIRVR|nr:glycoside hydrolase family 16 protein [Viridothelium virens]
MKAIFFSLLSFGRTFASVVPQGHDSKIARAPQDSSPGQCHVIQDVGTFMEHALYTFESSTMPDGLQISDGQPPVTTPGAPYTRVMTASSVSIQAPYLELTVVGGQTQSPIQGGEVSTAVTDILYASVRTRAIFSPVKGVCHGLFFYKSDTQETDIEYLTDPDSTSNPQNGSVPLQLTNQAADGVHDDETYTTYPAPDTANSEEHEYRVDWTSGTTTFYVDGVVAKTFTSNVPTVPGTWLWNNWSNGDKGWSVGPPIQDSVLKIRSIEMYYNQSSTQKSC